MRVTRILILSHKFYPDIGGIETVSEILATSFSKANYQVHVLTWSNEKAERVFPFVVIRHPSFRDLLKQHAWAHFILESNPCLRLSWPRLLYRRPSLIILQTWFSVENRPGGFSNVVKLRWLKRASKVVAISEAVRKRIWPAAIVIGNPYDVNTFKIMPEVPRTQDFAFVGRLVSDKGPSLAIQAINLLVNQKIEPGVEVRHYTLTVIGDGNDKADLEELVVRLQLQEHIKFSGALRGSELASCLNQHRFLIVPSIWEEPFGIVALEGMACGCVPIVSNGGGLPDVVGDAGLTFKSGNIESLVNTIGLVFNTPTLETKLRLAATSHLALFRSDKIAKRYLEEIESI